MDSSIIKSLTDTLIQKYGVCDDNGAEGVVIDITSSSDLTVNDITQYIMNLECYISRLKEIHWSAVDDKTHVLTDELIKKFSNYQDTMAEDYMGFSGTKFSIGFLNGGCGCECTTLPDLLNSLSEDTNLMYDVIRRATPSNRLRGMEHTLNEIMDTINRYLYKETQK